MDRELLIRHRFAHALQSVALLGMMALLLAWLAWILGGLLLALLAVALVLWLYMATPQVASWLAVRTVGATPLPPDAVPGLYRIVGELARRAELPRAPRLYYIPHPLVNALTVGSRTDPVIVLSDGLLRRLPGEEITAVLAHEIAHIKHGDIRLMTFADLASRMTRVLSLTGQFLILVNLPLLMIAEEPLPWLPLIVMALAPLGSDLLQLGLSRVREYDADVGAVHLLGDPMPLARALARLEQLQRGMLERFLLPGGGMNEPGLLRTHPPSEARIARLLAMREPALAERLTPVDVAEHLGWLPQAPRRR